jgi:hypothetical protein
VVKATKLLQSLDLLIAGSLKEAAAAAYQELEIDMAQMKERTPVETGALRGSGFVELPKFGAREVEITLGFGGPAIGYAVPVHENTTAHHEVGQAKYMESVLTESEPNMAARIARRMNLASVVK